MNIKLLTEYHLEFLSLKGGFIGSSETTLVKMPHRWKSLVTAQLCLGIYLKKWWVGVFYIDHYYSVCFLCVSATLYLLQCRQRCLTEE